MKPNRIISLLLAVIFTVTAAMAQTSQGDKFYNQGLTLQKTMTVTAQNQAIAKFKTAKKYYDSAAKKKQCDDAIAVSQQIIKSISPGPTPKPKKDTNTSTDDRPSMPQQQKTTLELGGSTFEITSEGKTIPVAVTTNRDDWSVSVETARDGSSFLSARRSDDNQLDIIVDENESTSPRIQRVKVTAGNESQYITVKQEGVPVRIEVSEPVIKFKAKGGSKEIYVLCNNAERYDYNSGENWYIEMKPEWVDVTIGVNKKESKAAELFNKGKKGLSSIFGKGNSEAESDPNMTITPIIITVPNVETDRQATMYGREFKVRLRSGDASVEFLVQQERKK